jgi:predicted 2-oxoglutarate/Fe(II)-dependent dioxygenase YbiX/peroxiredoxin
MDFARMACRVRPAGLKLARMHLPRYVNILPGDPAPIFQQKCTANPRYQFDVAAGRTLVLCFIGSSRNPHGQAAIAAGQARRDVFDDDHASFFGVTNDPADEAQSRLASSLPGFRHFFDDDFTISRLYGAWPADAGEIGFVGKWVVISPTLRVVAVIPFRPDGSDIAEAIACAANQPPPGRIAGMDVQAPVIVLERVFDPDFCRHLIGEYNTHGGELSGFMRDVDGQTRLVHDTTHKRRRDFIMENERDKARVKALIIRRIVPEIMKIHQFEVTRLERYLVACYAAEDEAHFRPHRDNTTKGTAHRRFAVSINLNDDFDGGELRFPEYGARSFKPSAGSAVIFSCSLLHAVTQVTRGKRYAFLPFLYDDAAAKIRSENEAFLAMPEDQGAA